MWLVFLFYLPGNPTYQVLTGEKARLFDHQFAGDVESNLPTKNWIFWNHEAVCNWPSQLTNGRTPQKWREALGLFFREFPAPRSGNWFGIVFLALPPFFPTQNQLATQRVALFSTVEIKGPLKWICPAIFGQKRPTHCKESCIGQNLNEIWWLCWSKDPKAHIKQLPGFMIYMLMTCLWSKSPHFTNTKSNEPTKTDTHT